MYGLCRPFCWKHEGFSWQCWIAEWGLPGQPRDADRNSVRASSPRGFARGAHDPGPSWAPGRNARWSDESDVPTSAVQNLRATSCSIPNVLWNKQPQVILSIVIITHGCSSYYLVGCSPSRKICGNHLGGSSSQFKGWNGGPLGIS